MAQAVLGGVQQKASEVTRSLPAAHSSWEFWKKAKFRRRTGEFRALVYSLRQKDLDNDELCTLLARAVDVVLNAIAVHVGTLSFSETRDLVDVNYFAGAMDELREARLSLEQGLAPNPALRPTDEQLVERLSELLSREPLHLPN